MSLDLQAILPSMENSHKVQIIFINQLVLVYAVGYRKITTRLHCFVLKDKNTNFNLQYSCTIIFVVKLYND